MKNLLTVVTSLLLATSSSFADEPFFRTVFGFPEHLYVNDSSIDLVANPTLPISVIIETISHNWSLRSRTEDRINDFPYDWSKLTPIEFFDYKILVYEFRRSPDILFLIKLRKLGFGHELHKSSNWERLGLIEAKFPHWPHVSLESNLNLPYLTNPDPAPSSPSNR